MSMRNFISLIVVAGLAFDSTSCTDPVPDAEIAALGPEDPGGPSADHRPGQPCVLCHSADGPASSKPFALAGTIYTAQDGQSGAPGIFVQYIDARGQGPFQLALPSGNSGNFFIPLEDAPNLAFPLRVAIYSDATLPPTQSMKSLIGREGSCNFCHKPLPTGSDITDDDKEAWKSSVGPIYSGTAAAAGGGG